MAAKILIINGIDNIFEFIFTNDQNVNILLIYTLYRCFLVFNRIFCTIVDNLT